MKKFFKIWIIFVFCLVILAIRIAFGALVQFFDEASDMVEICFDEFSKNA